MTQIRVRINVPDGWSDEDCDTFAESVKRDAERLALNVDKTRNAVELVGAVSGSVN